jgi:hypothetical protein
MTIDIATLGSTLQALLGFGTPPVLQATKGVSVAESSMADARGPGRPPGSGLRDRDMPLVVELDRRWRTGEAPTRTEAARELAEQAYGPNTERESKAWRLLRRHREYFSAPR